MTLRCPPLLKMMNGSRVFRRLLEYLSANASRHEDPKSAPSGGLLILIHTRITFSGVVIAGFIKSICIGDRSL